MSQKCQTWLLIDVDGTLVPEAPEPGVEHLTGCEQSLPVRPGAVRALRAASKVPGLQLGWYSAHEEDAPLLLGPLVSMERAPWVPLPEKMLDTPAYVKLEGLRAWLQDQPAGTRAVVLDDDPPAEADWPEAVVFVGVPPTGMDAEHVEYALAVLGLSLPGTCPQP